MEKWGSSGSTAWSSSSLIGPQPPALPHRNSKLIPEPELFRNKQLTPKKIFLAFGSLNKCLETHQSAVRSYFKSNPPSEKDA
jgi:hypothetical protein